MHDLVVFVEDRLRDKIVRLHVDADRRVDALIEWYVAHFGLPRRYFDLTTIKYRLVRALDKRFLPGKETLRRAGIADGELLQLVSRKGRQVWRTTEAVLDEIEQEVRGHIVEETWDGVTNCDADADTHNNANTDPYPDHHTHTNPALYPQTSRQLGGLYRETGGHALFAGPVQGYDGGPDPAGELLDQ